MEEIKLRIGIVQSVVEKRLSIGREDFDAELICIDLRKVLESIAFGSLVANKERYAQAHSNFASHWKAKRLLEDIEKIRPEFYPKPFEFASPEDRSKKHLSFILDGFLTRDEFGIRYDKCSEVLHSWNPFRDGPRVINFEYSITQWVEKIQRLLCVALYDACWNRQGLACSNGIAKRWKSSHFHGRAE